MATILCNATDVSPDCLQAPRKFLAQGDSWFSVGAFAPEFTTNILMNISLDQDIGIVTCAYPGKLLKDMVDWNAETLFARFLYGPMATEWDALLVSGGGNDLFNRLGLDFDDSNRVLLAPTERVGIPPADDCSHYVRQEGWNKLMDTLLVSIVALIGKRDGAGSQCAGAPILLHTYDYAQPRDAPATILIPGIGLGPWLSKAFTHYQIDSHDWLPLVQYLLDSWAAFVTGVNDTLKGPAHNLANPNVMLVKLTRTLTPASIDSHGPDGDWVNEIHPSPAGYEKLGVVYSAAIPPARKVYPVAETGDDEA